jgi:hypothetical protein
MDRLIGGYAIGSVCIVDASRKVAGSIPSEVIEFFS